MQRGQKVQIFKANNINNIFYKKFRTQNIFGIISFQSEPDFAQQKSKNKKIQQIEKKIQKNMEEIFSIDPFLGFTWDSFRMYR